MPEGEIIDNDIRKAEDLKLWRLCSHPKPLVTLATKRVVLVGDAAHPMLPRKRHQYHLEYWIDANSASLDQGQGGGMAIEDGGALGVLLSNVRSKEEIPARLQLFQQLRIDRVSAMVILSSVGHDESAKIVDIAQPYVKGPVPSAYSFVSKPTDSPPFEAFH